MAGHAVDDPEREDRETERQRDREAARPRDRSRMRATPARHVEQAESLLVLGSSLQVMSGLRFVRQASKRAIPVVIVNRGTTRGDDLADLKIDAGCAETLRDS